MILHRRAAPFWHIPGVQQNLRSGAIMMASLAFNAGMTEVIVSSARIPSPPAQAPTADSNTSERAYACHVNGVPRVFWKYP